jgi:TrmH family RNA methyltransferase
VLLEDVQDPGNLGSILRSTAAAGIRQVYLSAQCADLWSPRVLRAGMGAHFHLDCFAGVDLGGFAATFPGRLIATHLAARQSVFEVDLTGQIGLIFGNEGAGLSRALLDKVASVVAIPMPGQTESLNIAAAAAVCLFERVRQLG